MSQTRKKHIDPQDTIGYCVACNALVRRTKDAACENGHPQEFMRGARIVPRNEEMPVLPRFNWGAFFMPPLWGPAYGVWAGMVVLPLWLFMDSSLRSVVMLTPDTILRARVLTWAMAIFIVLATIVLMGWMGRTGYGLAWSRVYQSGVSEKSHQAFLRAQKWWAVGAGLMFTLFVSGAVYYWKYLL